LVAGGILGLGIAAIKLQTKLRPPDRDPYRRSGNYTVVLRLPQRGMLLLLELDPATPVEVTGHGAFDLRHLTQKKTFRFAPRGGPRDTNLDFSPGRLELEMKALNSNEVTEIDFYKVCFAPRPFGAGTSLAVLGTFLPAGLKLKAMPGGPETHPAPPGDAPSSESLVRSPGQKLSTQVAFP